MDRRPGPDPRCAHQRQRRRAPRAEPDFGGLPALALRAADRRQPRRPRPRSADLYLRTGGVHFPFLSACLDWSRAAPWRSCATLRRIPSPRARSTCASCFSASRPRTRSSSGQFERDLPARGDRIARPGLDPQASAKELEAMPIRERAFLEGFDGRTTLRRLLSPGPRNAPTRSSSCWSSSRSATSCCCPPASRMSNASSKATRPSGESSAS